LGYELDDYDLVETEEEFQEKPVYKIRTDGRYRKVVKKKCELESCDTVFLARKSKRKQGKSKFYSTSCSTKQQMGERDQSGENNPNWKGGISEDHYHYKKQQMERYPKRVKARKMVYEALKSGNLEKEPCEECGSEDDVQAHHEDYDEPLEVKWYCRVCHREIHEQE
jgi:hypothetical protein